MDFLNKMLYLLVVDVFFLLACVGIVFLAVLVFHLCGLKKHAALAVLRRNFVAYFSNPTGYVFLCVFVSLTSWYAFWPHEFFAANLANLDQLTGVLPGIMLIFIPAITMSIWAEERRQGTDELLLTIPATDFDIVVGKYLAAAAIFTCSLLFSQITSFMMLNSLALGQLDVGLFATTYLGYWLVGLTMLAIGMVASFLTSNLTVGFILGVVFNLPLVGLYFANTFAVTTTWTRLLSGWSIAEQMSDFSRGVVSLSSISYFVMIALVGVYLGMVLIGRRHWLGGRDGDSMLGHYILRTLALIVIAFGLNTFFTSCDARFDATDGQVSSLSPQTIKLMKELEPSHTVYVEAFISESLPDSLAKTRLELIAMLRGLDAAAKGKVEVIIHDNLELFDAQAVRAEEQFEIRPVGVRSVDRGAIKQERVLLGAVFNCGLQRVVVPFFSSGVPVEYELIRSVATAADEERKTIGVVRTDAELFGGLDFQMMRPRPRQLILDELEKQYEIVDVDPNSPIEENSYDVLLAVQPSSLTQPQLNNLVAAIQAGVPTAIFEDPFPVALRSAPGTSQPKMPRGGGMFGQQQPPEPKGDIQALWNMLGIEMEGDSEFGKHNAHIIWQEYNPYPKVSSLSTITDEWVFASPNAPGAKEDAINPDSPVVSGMQELLFLFPGAVKESINHPEELKFTPIVSTGNKTGYIKFEDLRRAGMEPGSVKKDQEVTNERYVLAALIEEVNEDDKEESDEKGKADDDTKKGAPGEAGDEGEQLAGEQLADGQLADDAPADDDEKKDDEQPAKRGIRVAFVTDIDLLHSDFISLREQPDPEMNWRFENVTFVLNLLDILANDDRFAEIRKRQLRHSTLLRVEQQAVAARDDVNKAIIDARKDSKEAEEKAEDDKDKAIKKVQDRVNELEKKREENPGSVNPNEYKDAVILLRIQQQAAEASEAKEKTKIKRDLDRKVEMKKRDLELKVRRIQMTYKIWAVVLPPIPPLLVAAVVFLRRRLREREGVARNRLR
jgi:ABC-2 type transport system permease protein